jgi:hypothetical protein
MPNDTSQKSVMSIADWSRERGAEEYPNLSHDEMEDRDRHISRMRDAQMVRDTSHPEFDDMDYLTYYETNQVADNAYLPSKKNPQDMRIVTGTTREKTNTLLSTLLQYNLEPTIIPFDETDAPLYEMGEILESEVKKSREIEDWDFKRPFIYRECLAQGICFILESWFEPYMRQKVAEYDWKDGVNTDKFKLKSDKIVKLDGVCTATMIPGTKVYLEDFRQPDIRQQPGVFLVEEIPWERARELYGAWNRWKYVPKRIVHTLSDTSDEIIFRDWTLLTTRRDWVEVLKVFDKPNNVFQLYLNGVPMLPVGYPLSEVSPSGEYPIGVGMGEVIPFCAYPKGIPAKTKVDQAVADEMLKLAILKTQQSFGPPMANNTGKQFKASMLYPFSVHDNIDPTKLSPIIEPTGVTSAELEFMQYLDEVMANKTINAAYQGTTGKKMTATELLEQKKGQLAKLGQIIWGVVQLEKQMNWLRVYNIVANWTKPVNEKLDSVRNQIKKTYRTVTVQDDLDDGQEGLKVIEFNPTMAKNATSQQIKDEEKLYTAKYNKPTRLYYVDPEELRSAKLSWFITIQPTEQNTSELQRTMFVQNIRDAATIFGPQSLNFSYLKDRFAAYMKEDRNKFFVDDSKLQQSPGAQQLGPDGQPMNPAQGAQQGLQEPPMAQKPDGGSAPPKGIKNAVSKPAMKQLLSPVGMR